MILPCQRHLFEIPEEVSYLNCAYLSPLMKAVSEAGVAGLRRKAAPWEIVAEDFFTGSEAARSGFARLLGCDPGCVSIAPSVSYGVGVAAANLPMGPGRRVVLLEEQFPSNVYPWLARAEATGAEVVFAARDAGGADAWTAPLLSLIDERTAVVAVPACHWTDGTTVDLVAVSRRCREVGAALSLDLTQSLGACPFDLEGVQPDFVVAAAYKWLLGPYGLAFMYAAPRHLGGVPLEFGWINREGSEDFAQLVRYREGFAPGARRYDVGQRSNFVTLPMIAAALDQIQAWGVEAIAETLGALTGEIAARAAVLGLEVCEARAPHMLGLRAPGGLPEGLARHLVEAKVFVSVRGDAIRVSPHLYNGARDLERLFGALERFKPGGFT